MSDSNLLGRLLAVEQKAYRELVARYQGAMRAVAYAIVGSPTPMRWCRMPGSSWRAAWQVFKAAPASRPGC